MAVIIVPNGADNSDKQEVQSNHIQTLIDNGWITTSVIFDKATKKPVSTVLVLPDKTMSSHLPDPSAKKSSVPKFDIGESVEVIDIADPDAEEFSKQLIGKVGKFIGVYNGSSLSKYQNFVAIRFDDPLYFLSDCGGMTEDYRGFFCKASAIKSLKPTVKETKPAPFKDGDIVIVLSNEYGDGLGYVVNKEGVYRYKRSNGLNVVEFRDAYGSKFNAHLEDGTFKTVSKFVPEFAVTLNSGDIVKVIVANDNVGKGYIGKLAYVVGPLSEKSSSPMDAIRIQLRIIGTNTIDDKTGKTTEHKWECNVNCIEPVNPNDVFGGINKGDTVTIIDIPDYPQLGGTGKNWIGREAKFLGFPSGDVYYRYKYFAELEVEDGKKLYAAPGTIIKGTAKKNKIPKIGDQVTIPKHVPAMNNYLSAASFNNYCKDKVGEIYDIFYSPGSKDHGIYFLTFANLSSISLAKEFFEIC